MWVVREGRLVQGGTAAFVVVIVNVRELLQRGHGQARRFLDNRERLGVLSRLSKAVGYRGDQEELFVLRDASN